MAVNVQIPVRVGQRVYKICPKCNDEHNCTCKNCAWSGCIWNYCSIDVRVESDGSYNKHKKQIVQVNVNECNFIHIIDEWNITYFDNIVEANAAIKEYEQIVAIADRHKRVEKFDAWREARKIWNELRCK